VLDFTVCTDSGKLPQQQHRPAVCNYHGIAVWWSSCTNIHLSSGNGRHNSHCDLCSIVCSKFSSSRSNRILLELANPRFWCCTEQVKINHSLLIDEPNSVGHFWWNNFYSIIPFIIVVSKIPAVLMQSFWQFFFQNFQVFTECEHMMKYFIFCILLIKLTCAFGLFSVISYAHCIKLTLLFKCCHIGGSCSLKRMSDDRWC